jgi:vacuolar-type H+-ATPase subunit E/Vma4
METLGSIASVIAAIRDDAAAEVERFDRETFEVPQETVTIGDRDAQIAAVHRENRERIAQFEWESRRTIVEQREAWIARVREAAHQRWDPEKNLEALAREALERIPGEECRIAVAVKRRLPAGLARLTHKRLTVTTAPIAGGCIVSSGGVAFDNSFEEREHRLEAEWRRALSALYKA